MNAQNNFSSPFYGVSATIFTAYSAVKNLLIDRKKVQIDDEKSIDSNNDGEKRKFMKETRAAN